ncbi:MAG: hypothetical protein SGJ05_05435 [bacterium]|nr:hypothetical protein [bacterium]
MIKQTLSLLATALTVATTVVAQNDSASSTISAALRGPFLGPLASYHIPLSSPENVTGEGVTAFGVGVVYTLPIAKTNEIRLHSIFRSESGSFTTFQTSTPTAELNSSDHQIAEPRSNRLHVVEPGAKPYVSSNLKLSAIELGATFWFRVAHVDNMGTSVFVGIGAFGDRVLSGSQTDDYTFADRGPTDPIQRNYEYAGQFGGGGLFGASLTLPLGGSRLAFDILYALRLPSEISGQNIEWLNGRSLRIGVHYDFGL